MMMKNTMEFRPDIRKAMNAADELLLAAIAVTTFPYSVTELIKCTTDIQVRSFQYLRQKGINPLAFGSEDALIFSYNGMVIMAYDRMAVTTRIRFSILHELGHFILNHDMRQDIPKALYDKQEVEANYFAAQLLMPEQILGELRRRLVRLDRQALKKYFGVSGESSDIRLGNLDQGLAIRSRWPGEYDDIILDRYREFIQSIAPIRTDIILYDDEYERQRERDSWYY